MRRYEWLISRRCLFGDRRRKIIFCLSIALIICVIILENFIFNCEKLIKKDILGRGIFAHIGIFIERGEVFDFINKIKELYSSDIDKIYRLKTAQFLLDFFGRRILVRAFGINKAYLDDFDFIKNKHSFKKQNVIISSKLAKYLNIKIGDSILLSTFYILGHKKEIIARCAVSDIFVSQENIIFLYDELINISGVDNTSVVCIKLKDPYKIKSIMNNKMIKNNYNIDNIEIFLPLDKTILFSSIITRLSNIRNVVSISGFIIGILIIILLFFIFRISKDINTLTLLGIPKSSINNIFLIQLILMLITASIIGLFINMILNRCI